MAPFFLSNDLCFAVTISFQLFWSPRHMIVLIVVFFLPSPFYLKYAFYKQVAIIEFITLAIFNGVYVP